MLSLKALYNLHSVLGKQQFYVEQNGSDIIITSNYVLLKTKEN